jgi:membrane protease subunit HflC
MNRWVSLLLVVLTLAVASLFCVVILDEREQAFRTLLNEPEPSVFGGAEPPDLTEPGWYLRFPSECTSTISETSNSTPHSLNTVDRTLVDLDYYVIWRIANPQRFFESNRGEAAALQRIDELTYSEVRETVNQHTLRDLLSDRRGQVEREITASAAGALEPLGVAVVDVRIGGTLYPEANVGRVYERMRTERSRFALKFRAEGEQQARGIRSGRGRGLVIVARRSASRSACAARATPRRRTYADVRRGPRVLHLRAQPEAYKKSLDPETTLVLSPKSSFLKYLFDPAPPAPPKP